MSEGIYLLEMTNKEREREVMKTKRGKNVHKFEIVMGFFFANFGFGRKERQFATLFEKVKHFYLKGTRRNIKFV